MTGRSSLVMKQESMKTKELFDLTKTLAAELLAGTEYPWEALTGIKEMIVRIGATLSSTEYEKRGEDVWVAKDAKVAPTAYIGGPAIIGHQAEVRHCAFIRGSALVGNNAVVGNSTELKNVILFDAVQVPHYNYVGDSILGYKAHMGAGAITSNVKADKALVMIHAEDGELATKQKKVGAILGDYAEIGCNTVLNPGTIIGKNTNVYPLSNVRGCIDANHIYKQKGEIVKKK